MKKVFTSLVVLAAVSTVAANPVAAQSSYVVYNTFYYSDATHSQQVGVLRGSCGRYGPQYTLYGTQSPYSEEEEVGICEGGVIGPIE